MRRASNMEKEDDVKGQLDSIQKQLDDIRAVVFKQKSPDLDLYWSIVISAFIGILGNAMVSFYIQTEAPVRFLGLALSGIFLIALILILVVRMLEVKKRKL